MKRLKTRKANKGRGYEEEEDDYTKREVEVNNNAMRYAARYVGVHHQKPFIFVEIFINLVEKAFIFLSRDLKYYRIIQRLALPWNAVGLTEKFGSLDSEYKLKHVRKVFQQYVKKERKKISISYLSKSNQGQDSKIDIGDEYKRKLEVEDFSTDKFMVLISIKKEKSKEINNLKLVLNWYYHCLHKQIFITIIGSSRKWEKKTILIDV